jgi:hypothetical protein
MLVFQNDGVLPIEGFTTFGMSAKPGSTNPIGKFGTGLKNAVAIILRLGGEVRVWRGLEEYIFYTKDEEFRGTTFKRLRMKRRKGLLPWKYEVLPFTTELGKHWEPWMAFRELESNTRDEKNGSTAYIGTEGPLQYLPREGTTLILVDCPEMDEAYANIDDIFLPEKKPIFENDAVKIYEGASNYVFYRGLRVTALRKPSLFTYEMKYVNLTEDRTSMYTFMDDNAMMKALLACPDTAIVRKIVTAGDGAHESTFEWDKKNPAVSGAWRSALSFGNLSPRMSTLRDNLDFGLGSDQDVDVCLTVAEWNRVLQALTEVGSPLVDTIKEQLTEEGWRPLAPWDEIAKEAECASSQDSADAAEGLVSSHDEANPSST